MKVLPYRLYDGVLLDEFDINVGERNHIMRLTSLNYNQFSSKVFRRMTQYARYASGFTKKHPESYRSVTDLCFSFDVTVCVVPFWDAASFIC